MSKYYHSHCYAETGARSVWVCTVFPEPNRPVTHYEIRDGFGGVLVLRSTFADLVKACGPDEFEVLWNALTAHQREPILRAAGYLAPSNLDGLYLLQCELAPGDAGVLHRFRHHVGHA